MQNNIKIRVIIGENKYKFLKENEVDDAFSSITSDEENLRLDNFLKELESKTNFYGKEFIEFVKNANNKTYQEKINLAKNLGFRPAGSGTNRDVLLFPSNEDLILKISKDDSTIPNNTPVITGKIATSEEGKDYPQYRELMPKIYEKDPRGEWIVVEKAIPVGSDPNLRNKAYSIIAPELKNFQNATTILQEILEYYILSLDIKEIKNSSINNNEKQQKIREIQSHQMQLKTKLDNEINPNLITTISKRPFFVRLVNFMKDTDSNPRDFRMNNLGFVERDNKLNLVLLDASRGFKEGSLYDRKSLSRKEYIDSRNMYGSMEKANDIMQQIRNKNIKINELDANIKEIKKAYTNKQISTQEASRQINNIENDILNLENDIKDLRKEYAKKVSKAIEREKDIESSQISRERGSLPKEIEERRKALARFGRTIRPPGNKS